MNTIRKLKNLAIRIINIDKKLSEVKESLGRIEARQIKTMELENINEAEQQVLQGKCIEELTDLDETSQTGIFNDGNHDGKAKIH